MKYDYYLTHRDFTYFTRVFPRAAELDWFETESGDSRVYLKIGLDTICEEETSFLGTDKDALVRQLKNLLKTDRKSSRKKQFRFRIKQDIQTGLRKAFSLFTLLVQLAIIAGILFVYDVKPLRDEAVVGVVNSLHHPGLQPGNFRELLEISIQPVLENMNSETGTTAEPEESSSETRKIVGIRGRPEQEGVSPVPDQQPGSEKKRAETGNLPQENAGVDPKEIETILKRCEKNFRAKRYTTGEGETALACYRKVLKMDIHNTAALKGISRMEKIYLKWAARAVKRKDAGKLQQYIEALEKVNPDSSELKVLRFELSGMKH